MSLARHSLMRRTALFWITGRPDQLFCMLVRDPLRDASLPGKKKVYLITCACRPVGRMFAPYMAFSSDYGAVTDQQSCVLVLVFSEPIVGLVATQFKVSGPTSTSVTGLKLLQGTSSYYHAIVVIAATYTGQVTVAFSVSPEDLPQVSLDSYRSLKVHLMHPQSILEDMQITEIFHQSMCIVTGASQGCDRKRKHSPATPSILQGS